MKRSAPLNGYNFGNKRQYRRHIWSAARSFCDPCDRSSAQILLMPSIEGKEIEVAENNGFRQCNMHIVDNNPAIVAHLKRRYPYITTYGVDLVSAVKRIAKAGIKLKIANFDLCSTAEKLSPMLYEISKLQAFAEPQHLIFVTFQRGRDREAGDFARRNLTPRPEHKNTTWLIDGGKRLGLSVADTWRFWKCYVPFYDVRNEQWMGHLYKPVMPRIYRSNAGTLTMMYFGVWREPRTKEAEAWWRKRISNAHKPQIEISDKVKIVASVIDAHPLEKDSDKIKLLK
jgi:hypothetical protein